MDYIAKNCSTNAKKDYSIKNLVDKYNSIANSVVLYGQNQSSMSPQYQVVFDKDIYYNDSEKTLIDRVFLRSRLTRIVRSEAKHITNTSMFYAIKDKAKFIIVHGAGTGIECDCSANWGTFPAEDFDATTMLPPFHPDCACSFYAIIEEENE